MNFILLPFIGGIIGWCTNKLAIKLIFRPVKPIKIPFINIVFHGLLPKRKKELAKIIGKTVDEEFLSIDDIIYKTDNSRIKEQALNIIKNKISEKANEKMPFFIPNSINKIINNFVNEIINKEGKNILDEITAKMEDYMKDEIKVNTIVEEKINELEIQKLEEIIVKVSNRELKHIEYLGGIIGFFIGIGQALLLFIV